jgi:hypothetical protein
VSSLLVTYDLVGTDETSKDYNDLIAAIKSRSGWARVAKSVWIVRSAESAKALRDSLLHHMDSNDRLFVAALSGTAAWHAVMCNDSWLKQNL